MGWWGTFGATESLQFYPDSFINASSQSQPKYLVLHLKNTGSASAVIYKVEISGLGTVTTKFASATTYITTTSTLTEVTVGPGTEVYVVVSVPGTPIAGANYLVKVYTRAGNVYSVTVQAKA